MMFTEYDTALGWCDACSRIGCSPFLGCSQRSMSNAWVCRRLCAVYKNASQHIKLPSGDICRTLGAREISTFINASSLTLETKRVKRGRLPSYAEIRSLSLGLVLRSTIHRHHVSSHTKWRPKERRQQSKLSEYVTFSASIQSESVKTTASRRQTPFPQALYYLA